MDSGDFRINIQFLALALEKFKKHQGLKAAVKGFVESQRILKTPSLTQTNRQRMIGVLKLTRFAIHRTKKDPPGRRYM